jgi:hypothetical protein
MLVMERFLAAAEGVAGWSRYRSTADAGRSRDNHATRDKRTLPGYTIRRVEMRWPTGRLEHTVRK